MIVDADATWAPANPTLREATGAAGISDEYWVNSNVAESRADGTDPAAAARLWAVTEEIIARLLVR